MLKASRGPRFSRTQKVLNGGSWAVNPPAGAAPSGQQHRVLEDGAVGAGGAKQLSGPNVCSLHFRVPDGHCSIPHLVP
ncbi:hypothetical protein CHLRE_17g702102v5 [Chlamydomonas reinhardtii]|uniref:Uncharacterized protein n=1 Tax=Chlamydomonas reinhardtii TaxID=3055 RepID=A0A2K3CP04_CHLRE|nr:uncharacterized protein CHLRE_17g702102v5 [Chlamydomonas reinhardtii]PNW70014.1 hypothetical protein CHLRE_17g702102v5 [Chlamydomonas reinhardtii]